MNLPSCRPRALAALAVASVLLHVADRAAHAQRVVWPVNGHLYAVVQAPGGISWCAANTAAQAAGAHLATITSAAENDLVFSLIDDPRYWNQEPGGSDLGPWLGGHQTSDTGDPAANWVWVTGEPWSYTSWSSGEPNNYTGAAENYLSYKCYGTSGCRASGWNDLPDLISQYGTAVLAYVIEFDGPAAVEGGGTIGALELHPATPNPFVNSTVVRFDLPSASPVRLMVVDAAGRRIRTLLDASLGAGPHALEWDGRDANGVMMPPGCYFARLVAGTTCRSITMLHMR